MGIVVYKTSSSHLHPNHSRVNVAEGCHEKRNSVEKFTSVYDPTQAHCDGGLSNESIAWSIYHDVSRLFKNTQATAYGG